jgi:hypothetical protein
MDGPRAAPKSILDVHESEQPSSGSFHTYAPMLGVGLGLVLAIALIASLVWYQSTLNQDRVSPQDERIGQAEEVPGKPTFPHVVLAYDAPNGNLLGGIEPGRAYNVVTRQDDGWQHVEVEGSGMVWIFGTGETPPIAVVTPVPTAAPAQPRWQPAVAAQPASPPCREVIDGDRGGVLGTACAWSAEDRAATAQALLLNAP